MTNQSTNTLSDNALHDIAASRRRPRGKRVGTDPLGDEIAELCANLDAAQYRLLALLRRFDDANGWEGFRSCAEWLAWRGGLSVGAARERVRVARCLSKLPGVSSNMRRGLLSWSKVRAVTRVATPENEGRLIDFARHHTASQLERFVRTVRSAEAAASTTEKGEPRTAARRGLSIRLDEEGMYRISGQLTPEVGTQLVHALQAAGDELYRAEKAAEREAEKVADGQPGDEGEQSGDEEDGGEPPPPTVSRMPRARRHDALAAWLEGATDAKVQVVVHTVAGSPDVVTTDEGSHVPAETSRRLCCDAEAVQMVRGANGTVLDMGRRRRTVDSRLKRALAVRDGGCRFPDCGRKHTQAHHAIPWAEGGRTALDNLILLCRYHHRKVHEGGWRVEIEDGASGRARFLAPDGRVVPALPPEQENVSVPQTRDAGLGAWHRQQEIGPWTAAGEWMGGRLDLGWSFWVLWGRHRSQPSAI